MNLDSSLLYQIVNSKSPTLLKSLDPALGFKKKAVYFLDESYHMIDLLQKIDLSHFEIIYDSFAKKDILFIYNTIRKEQNNLLNSFIKQDCLERLFKLTPCMPYKYLPVFGGSSILFLDSTQVKQLILLLGIYDLKQALKTLIDQTILTQIDKSLSDLQKLFLKDLAKEKDKVAFKRLPLESWDLQKNSLEALIYLRGLNRFSKAYSEVDFFIRNELILRLPLKDKQQFMNLSTKVELSIKEALCEEIEHTIAFMKKNLKL